MFVGEWPDTYYQVLQQADRRFDCGRPAYYPILTWHHWHRGSERHYDFTKVFHFVAVCGGRFRSICYTEHEKCPNQALFALHRLSTLRLFYHARHPDAVIPSCKFVRQVDLRGANNASCSSMSAWPVLWRIFSIHKGGGVLL